MRIIAIIIFHVISLSIFAGEIAFETLTSDNGLSQNDVLSIFQDSDGFMWFGTIDGLNRYDGYEFKTYRVNPDKSNSLSSNLIRCITEDHKNNLWIGTLNKGICKFEKRTEEFTHFKNTLEQPGIITDNFIKSIFCDSKNNIWAATEAGVTFISDDSTGEHFIKKIKHESNNPGSLYNDRVEVIYEDWNGNIIIGAVYALSVMNKTPDGEPQNNFLHITTPFQEHQVRSIIQTEEGYLISRYSDIIILNIDFDNPNELTTKLISTCSTHQFERDLDGNLWASGHKGIYRFEYTRGKEMPYKLTHHFTEGKPPETVTSQYIRSTFIDNAGIIWFGTNGGGIAIYNPTKTKIRHYKLTDRPGSISNNRIWGILEDNEQNIWMGTEGGGLNLLPAHNSKKYHSGFIHYDVNPPEGQNFVKEIIQVSTSNNPELWAGVGYPSKLVSIKKSNGNWAIEPIIQEISNNVLCLCKDENGAIWLGTYDAGLYKFVQNKIGGRLINYTPTNSFLPSTIIRYIKEDSKGRLWFATSEGLAVLTREQKQSEAPEFVVFKNNLNDSLSISNSYVVPVMETTDGDIWVGTFGGGINKYIEGTNETNGHFDRLGVKDGLPNDMIKQIVEDDEGHLWISSNRGLTRYNRSTKEIRNFDILDGLQGWEFTDLSGCKLSNGEILFGGKNGFNAFHPNEISVDTTLPNQVFTKFEIFNNTIKIGQNINGRILLKQSIDNTDKLSLKYFENNFTIHFAGLHYSAPQKMLYKYILEGYDKEWYTTTSDHRFSKYTNLEPGRYTFMFRASNSDGIWVEQSKKIIIIIEPPFWQTWWFRIAFVILLGFSIVSIFYLRTRKIRKRNLELTSEVRKQTEQIRQKNKVLTEQTEELNETNTILEERQQRIEEQAEELRAQRDELFESNTVMEERQQRIEELAEELTAQRDELSHTNSIKDKLFSIVAHDLKNPFNTLAGFMEILDLKYDKYTDDKRKSMIKYALASVGNIQGLLLNLLSWARAQSGQIIFKPAQIEIIEILKQNLVVIEFQAADKNINIEFSSNQPTVVINADMDLLNVVFRNLLVNAIKFTPRDGSIFVKCHDNQNKLEIKIEDTGIGISPENMEKLFRKDVHITTYGTADEKGTGLGLITSKDFIEMHEGSINVESTEGEGTTFTITLPKLDFT